MDKGNKYLDVLFLISGRKRFKVAYLVSPINIIAHTLKHIRNTILN